MQHSTDIDKLLLSLPLPQDIEPVGSWDEYEKKVKSILIGKPQNELEAAIDYTMTLFNAENFTGLLTDGERETFRALLEAYDGPYLKQKSINPQQNEELAKDPEELRKKDELFAINKKHHQFLECDGEIAAPSMAQCGLLIVSIALAKMLPRTSIWRLRVYFRWQMCLTHRAHSLYDELIKCVEVLGHPESDARKSIGVPLFLELGHVLHYFHKSEEAGKLFFHALQTSGLKIEESAILGVRTRYQVISHAQQVLLATSTRPLPAQSESEASYPMPKQVGSFKDGHDFYERPKALKKGEDAGAEQEAEGLAADLTETELREQQKVTEVQPLHPDDIAIILALSVNIKNTNPYFGLTKHHIGYYMDRLIVDPAAPIFVFRCMMMLIRCRVEAQRNRVQERAFLQLQELIDQFGVRGYSSGMLAGQTTQGAGGFDQGNTTAAVSQEIGNLYRCDSRYFYQVVWPPLWELKRELAYECTELTMHKTALDLYEDVKDWDGVIECCTKLDRRRKAESLITDMLKRDPENVTLLTALGDATREDKYLWKAWELCNHKRAAPMRSLARLAVERREFDKVVEYFDQAVNINPLFGGDWFSLGYACMKTKNIERAGEAFTRVCQMTPDDPYAWANLAAVLLELKKERAAFNAMSQAVRNNRRAWQFWDNYFHIGVELKEVTECTLALETTIDMAKKNYQLDDVCMKQFTEVCMQYLQGQIDGSGVEIDMPAHKKVNSGCQEMIQHHRFEGTAAEEALANLDEEEADDGDAAVWANMEPLLSGEGFDLPEIFKKKEEQKQKEEEALRESRARSMQRFKARIEKILLSMTDLFVTNAQLFATCAEVLGFMHGPRKAFDYRVSQLRAAQTPAWERSDSTFEEVVKILTEMGELAQRISESGEQQTNNTEEQSSSAAASTSVATTSSPTSDSSAVENDNKKADPFYPVRTTQSFAEEAAKMAVDHMEDHVGYRKLKNLSKRLKALLPK